jgi:hypothetical protein
MDRNREREREREREGRIKVDHGRQVNMNTSRGRDALNKKEHVFEQKETNRKQTGQEGRIGAVVGQDTADHYESARA